LTAALLRRCVFGDAGLAASVGGLAAGVPAEALRAAVLGVVEQPVDAGRDGAAAVRAGESVALRAVGIRAFLAEPPWPQPVDKHTLPVVFLGGP